MAEGVADRPPCGKVLGKRHGVLCLPCPSGLTVRLTAGCGGVLDSQCAARQYSTSVPRQFALTFASPPTSRFGFSCSFVASLSSWWWSPRRSSGGRFWSGFPGSCNPRSLVLMSNVDAAALCGAVCPSSSCRLGWWVPCGKRRSSCSRLGLCLCLRSSSAAARLPWLRCSALGLLCFAILRLFFCDWCPPPRSCASQTSANSRFTPR